MIAMAVDFSKNVYCRVKKLTNYFQCYAQSIFLRPCYLPMRSKNVGYRKKRYQLSNRIMENILEYYNENENYRLIY